MVIKVGVNSFGRIGRVIFRTCYKNSEIEVSAINDPAIDLEYICYLIKFDSTHGKFPGTVTNEGDEIKINDRSVKVFHHKAPADIPWHEAGVQYVVEASGMFTSVEKASGHLTSDGVKRVIVTAPSADAPMLILGVNEDSIQPDMKVISCASSTLYCLAPIIKVLEDAYGVAEGFVTSIHAMTPSLKPLDGLCVRGKHWRDHRSIHQNIIPASTGACRALGAIVPSCRGKLAGLAFRVPVVNGSVLDLSVRLNKNTTIAEISKTIEELTNSSLRNIIQVSNEKAVSSDFAGDTHSCVLDIDSSLQIKPNFFKLICWYENEYSYSCRVIDTVLFLERQHQAQISPLTRIMYMRPISSNMRIENSRGDETKQYVSFCVPNLQNKRPNITLGSHNAQGHVLKSTTVQSPTCKLGQPTNLEEKESIKSYIEGLTKCKCNETQNKIEIRRKDSLDDEKRLKAEYCFKKVEKEISEMLNMAEELLNKPSSKKLQSTKQSKKTSEDKLLEHRHIMRKNIIAKISDTLEKIRQVKINTRNTDIIEDSKSSVLDVGNHQDKVNMSKREGVSFKKSYFKMPLKSISPTKCINSNSNVILKKSNSWMIKKHPDSRVNTMNAVLPFKEINKSYFTNHLKSQNIKETKAKLIEGKSEYVNPSLLDCLTNDHKEDDTISVASIVSKKLENTLKILNVPKQDPSIVTDTYTKNCDKDSESNSHTAVKTKSSETKDVTKTVESNSIFIMDRKLEPFSKENMKQHRVEEGNAMNETKNLNDDIKVEIVDKAPENTQDFPGSSNSPIENDSGKSSSGIMSSYSGPSISKNNCSYKNEDIFDKLDSESISDSGSSYRIREKTSQVIKITDLTYSLEDLPRLDKICRVMEISDELTDKLFSPLDNENYENASRRKWSFQDLCERIKFDEFCNELFEKHAT